MENASKALIIAGAILLSILLISLGIMIFNKGTDIVEGTGLDSEKIQTWNAKLTKYEGDIKGTLVKEMINTVKSMNADNSNNEKGYYPISVYGGTTEPTNIPSTLGSEKMTISTSTIKNTKTYTVAVIYDNGSGCISALWVKGATEVTGGGTP